MRTRYKANLLAGGRGCRWDAGKSRALSPTDGCGKRVRSAIPQWKRGCTAFVVGLALALFCEDSLAYDQQVTSNLWAEGYTVYSPNGEQIRSRRIVEDLYLGAWNLIPNSNDPYYRGPRLSIELALRLDTDFAVESGESNRDSELNYVPGLTPIQFDLMIAYVDIQDLWRGRLDVRFGRQIRIDTIGFFAFDGIETSLRLPIHLKLAGFIGFEVRGGQAMGWDALELDGTDTGGQNKMESDRYPDRKEPKSRLAVGVEAVFTPVTWAEAALAYRVVGLSMPLVDERLAGQISLGKDSVRGRGRVQWSPLLNQINEIEVEVAVTPWDMVSFVIDYNMFRPIFEADSIFNIFHLSHQNDLGGRVDLRILPRLKAAVWGFARLADESAGVDGAGTDELIAGAGGGIGGHYATSDRELSLRLSMAEEWGEKQIGGEIGMGKGFLANGRLWLRLRCSVWHITDAFSEFMSGNLAGYVASFKFRLADNAYVLAELEHYVGSDRGQRFYALALLQLDLWR